MVITALIIIITCTVAFTKVTTVTIVAVSTVILSMSPTTAPIRRVLAAGLLDHALGFFPFEPGVHPFICDELGERPRRYLGQGVLGHPIERQNRRMRRICGHRMPGSDHHPSSLPPSLA